MWLDVTAFGTYAEVWDPCKVAICKAAGDHSRSRANSPPCPVTPTGPGWVWEASVTTLASCRWQEQSVLGSGAARLYSM